MGLDLKRTSPASPRGRGLSSSPKGMQQKWYDPVKRNYYKLDSAGHQEGLVECVVSNLLEHTAIDGEPTPHINYRLEDLNGVVVSVSKSFLEPGERELSLMSIINSIGELAYIDDDMALQVDCKIKRIISYVSESFGVPQLEKLYGAVMLFDFVVCNEDRHWGNTSIIRGAAGYRVAPIFDAGNALQCKLSNIEHARDTFEPRPYNADQLYALPYLMGDSKLQIYRSAIDFEKLRVSLCEFYPEVVVDSYLQLTASLLDTCKESVWSAYLEVL